MSGRGRPRKYNTDEERAAAKKECDRLYYLKNREKFRENSARRYKESIGGEYKYKSKNSDVSHERERELLEYMFKYDHGSIF